MERSAANCEKSSKADTSKDSASRIRSAVENDRTMEIDPIRGLVQQSGCRGCGPSLESLAIGMASMPGAQRRQAALSLQRTRGNRFVQRMAMAAQVPVQAKREPNRTGMPDGLKEGIESISGLDMSDVQVHVNSDKPAKLNALAYTQGNQIYLGPGQEKHLAHEAWHAVQQKEERVQAMRQIKGFGINDDSSLEHEADLMGAKAERFVPNPEKEPLQGKFGEKLKQKPTNISWQTERDCIEYSAESNKIHRLLAGITKSVVQKRDANLNSLNYLKNNVERPRTVRYGERGEVSEQDNPYTGPILAESNSLMGLLASCSEEIQRIGQTTDIATATMNRNDKRTDRNAPPKWVPANAGLGRLIDIDPLNVIIRGRYRINGTSRNVEMTVHFGQFENGYITQQKEGGTEAIMRNHIGMGIEYGSRHRSIVSSMGVQELLDKDITDLDDSDVGAMIELDRKQAALDARTIVSAEGSRYVPVRIHAMNGQLLDNSKFFYRESTDDVCYITFKRMYQSWERDFQQKFGIESQDIINVLLRKVGNIKNKAKLSDMTHGIDFDLDNNRTY